MPELRPLRRIVIAAAWLLATYFVPDAARAQPAPAPDETSCAAGQIEPARFRLGTAAGPLGASTAIADFNSDGLPDVAIADRIGPQSGASHHFRLQVVLAGLDSVSLDVDSTESALALSVADVDQDHGLDIVLSRPLSGETVGVWLNDGTGRFTSAPVARFRRPATRLAAMEALASDAPAFARLPSRLSHGVVPRAAIAGVHDAARMLSTSAPAVPPALRCTASRPRSPPALYSLFS
jgi:hypothetical protein